MKRISLSVFFPTYNEEANIEAAIKNASKVLEDSPYVYEHEIIVVNDGSKDKTREIVEKIALENKKVRLINHGINQGYGAALKTGIRSANMEYVFFTDADLQFDLLDIVSLIIYLPEHPVVIGYRSPRKDPPLRLLNAWGWNILNRIFFGLKVKDIDCAFKIFKREEIHNLPIHSNGAMINAEILIRLFARNVPIKEVPVLHKPRVAGSPTGAKPSVIIKAFREMISLYTKEFIPRSYVQAFKYMQVGVINTLLDITIYFALTRGTEVFADNLTLAKFLSFFVGTISSLTLNRKWTFNLNSKLQMREVLRFYTVTAVAIGINVLCMNLLLYLGWNDVAALAATTILTFIVSFILSKKWVFQSTLLKPKTYASYSN